MPANYLEVKLPEKGGGWRRRSSAAQLPRGEATKIPVKGGGWRRRSSAGQLPGGEVTWLPVKCWMAREGEAVPANYLQVKPLS